ncbi:MAG: hypothetical protein IIV24_09035 [Alistipes sp.]|nr:hypothetical protein [Alistipes sp.]
MSKMLILHDEQRSISLNPFAIYVICDQSQSERYDRLVARLNRSKRYTRGCFKFERVVRGEQRPEALPNSLAQAIGKSDILVRLIDSVAGDYQYLIRERDDNAFNETDILDIVERISDENSKSLEDHCSLHRHEGESEGLEKLKRHFEYIRKKIRETRSKTPKTRTDMIGQILHSRGALLNNLQSRMLGEGALFNDDCCLGRSVPVCAHQFDPYRDEMRNLAKKMKEEGISRGELEMIMREVFGVYDIDSSNEIALGAVDAKYSGALERDQYHRNTPVEEVGVYIDIKKIPSPNGRKRRAYGVEISYNGKSYPVYMGSVDVRMVYLVSLLCHKAGGHLYQYLYKEQHRLKRPMWEWLNRAYNLIEPSKKISFTEWMRKIELLEARPVNQGASNARKLVEKSLDIGGKGAIYYTELVSERKYGSDSYYTFRIAPDHIRVDAELQELVDAYANLVA